MTSVPAASARADLLVRQLDTVWSLFTHHRPALDDAACLWEPAPGAWTVREDERGRWVPDWQVPEPDPVPTTSIAWLTWHIGYWWTTTLGHCFDGGSPEREEIFWPGGADGAVRWVQELKDRWRAELLRLGDSDLDSVERTRGLPWGEGLPLVDIASWVNFELAKNVSEIGLTLHLRKALAGRGVALGA
ncbi:DNA damage-inducible protein DinB [Streptomyces inusitatus]|uniref:DNA damage-inducible protein DinB n=1 Tax=Streptomyces inusitatus TaxID=68221 RepID=A0A918V1H1_9ACTN|nr:DinB family protein [Streptomyces inusitatus]GGZ53448.1 DNA damage-inducible protein DinB [Streptomyces inusitatus]